MYVHIISDKLTGEIWHCTTHPDDNAYTEPKTGKEYLPIVYEGGLPSNYVSSVFRNVEIEPDTPCNPIELRELYKMKLSVDEKSIAFDKRPIRGKMNEITGRILDDPSTYEEDIAKSKIEAAENELKRANMEERITQLENQLKGLLEK